jgi:hypothetical protein
MKLTINKFPSRNLLSKSIFLLIASSIAVTAYSASYSMRVATTESVSTYVPASSTFTDWVNSGEVYNCGIYSPPASSVELGQSFAQSRVCSQNQTRTEFVRLFDAFSQTYKNESTNLQTQTIDATETQAAVGTALNWVSSPSTFTAWENSGTPHSQSAWTPAIVAQTANFSQTRIYSQDQTRSEQPREYNANTAAYRNAGEPIMRTQTLNGLNETRAVTISSVDIGPHTSCGTWNTEASSVIAGQSFIRQRNCLTTQQYTYSFSGGSQIINRGQSIIESETAVGISLAWGLKYFYEYRYYNTWTELGQAFTNPVVYQQGTACGVVPRVLYTPGQSDDVYKDGRMQIKTPVYVQNCQ